MSALVLAAAALAGGAGSLLRLELTDRAVRAGRAGAAGTASANLLATVLLAVVLALETRGLLDAPAVTALGLGASGGLSTFSTWVVDGARASASGARATGRVWAVELVGQLAVAVLLVLAVRGLLAG